jgi:hypothetical protein
VEVSDCLEETDGQAHRHEGAGLEIGCVSSLIVQARDAQLVNERSHRLG